MPVITASFGVRYGCPTARNVGGLTRIALAEKRPLTIEYAGHVHGNGARLNTRPMRSSNTIRHTKTIWKPTFFERGSDSRMGIYSQGEFSRLIQYERMRSDRLNQPLSLVTISPLDADVNGVSNGRRERFERVVRMLLDLLTSRARQTDALGWLDPNRIAVLLPSTDWNGAATFSKSVLEKISSDDRWSLVVEISSYPCLQSSGSGAPNGFPHRMALIRSGNLEPVLLRPIPRWKRGLDIVGASLGLLVCVPLFAVVALYIKLVSPGPVFFTQPRVGYGEREFRFIKFRTMHVNNDQGVHSTHATEFIRSNASMRKLDDTDPRIYFGGKLLRVSCIDELPQLYNVLRGDMSLVGPRPCIPYEAAEYQRWHRHRFSILPGLTGLWQVSGKNRLSFAEMIRLDIQYEKTMSLGLDLVIILRTIPTVFGLLTEAVARRLMRIHSSASEQPVPAREPEGSQS